MLRHVVTYAFRNLLRTRLRSAVAVLSITLVIALYTVLASIGNSFSRQVAQLLNRQQIDVVVQSRYAATPVGSSLPTSVVERLATMEHVRAAEALTISHRWINSDASVYLFGVSHFEEAAARLGLSVARGRPLRAGTREAVIGERTAAVLGLGIGDELDLGGGERAPVVGVYSTWLDFLNAGVVLDLHAAQELAGTPDRVNMLFLSLTDPACAPQVIDAVTRAYPTLVALSSQRLPQFLGPISNVLGFSRIVSAVALLVVFGIMLNTFVLSISERTQEIGILAAIGWSRRLICAVLLAESVLLSAAGALGGFAVAFPALHLMQRHLTSIFMYIPGAPDTPVLGQALGLGLLAGACSVLFPALHSTRLSVAAALRHG